jgi:hypothetical protein
MHRSLSAAIQLAGVMALGACAMSAPKYNGSFQTSQQLRDAGVEPVKVGEFSAAPESKDKVNHLSIRANPYASPYDNSFVAYLEQAVRQELEDSRLLDPNAGTQINGVLIRNELDGSGFSTGTADIEARFIVLRDGTVRFDRVKSTRHEWESSFVGATAIPAAAQNYPVAVQKLVASLFSDPEFVAALRSSAPDVATAMLGSAGCHVHDSTRAHPECVTGLRGMRAPDRHDSRSGRPAP